MEPELSFWNPFYSNVQEHFVASVQVTAHIFLPTCMPNFSYMCDLSEECRVNITLLVTLNIAGVIILQLVPQNSYNYFVPTNKETLIV